jgi:hypothetical protein
MQQQVASRGVVEFVLIETLQQVVTRVSVLFYLLKEVFFDYNAFFCLLLLVKILQALGLVGEVAVLGEWRTHSIAYHIALFNYLDVVALVTDGRAHKLLEAGSRVFLQTDLGILRVHVASTWLFSKWVLNFNLLLLIQNHVLKLLELSLLVGFLLSLGLLLLFALLFELLQNFLLFSVKWLHL